MPRVARICPLDEPGDGPPIGGLGLNLVVRPSVAARPFVGLVFSPCHFRFAAGKTVGLVASHVTLSGSVVGQSRRSPRAAIRHPAETGCRASAHRVGWGGVGWGGVGRGEVTAVGLRPCGSASLWDGRRGHHASLVEQSIAWERSSNALEHLLLRGGDLHLPQHLAQCAPALIWSDEPRFSERECRRVCPFSLPPSLRSGDASDILLRRSLNQILPDPFIPLYPSLLQKEVDRLRVLIL